MSLSMIDGPAADESFACRRRPELLRVVRSPSGKWDCLDQLEDEPRPREAIYLYECFHRGAGMFLCGRGMGAASGWQAEGHYRFVIAAKPASRLDETCRDTRRWRAFVAAYFDVTIDWSDGTEVAPVIPIRTARGA